MNPVRRMFAVGAASIGAWVGAAESSVPPVSSTGAPDARLSYAPGQPPPSWAVAVAETLMARWPDYTQAYHGSWTYVHGYAFCAFERLHQSTGDRRYWDYIVRFIDRHVDEDGNFRVVEDGRGQKRETTFHNLDNMLPGNALVMLYERTGSAHYRRAADTIHRALAEYPRNRDGGFWHSTLLPGQMWIDGIFMGQMFLTRYGNSIGDGEWAWNEAARQLLVYAQKGERGDTGLFVHGIYEPGHGERACKWADLVTGRSSVSSGPPRSWNGPGWGSSGHRHGEGERGTPSVHVQPIARRQRGKRGVRLLLIPEGDGGDGGSCGKGSRGRFRPAQKRKRFVRIHSRGGLWR